MNHARMNPPGRVSHSAADGVWWLQKKIGSGAKAWGSGKVERLTSGMHRPAPRRPTRRREPARAGGGDRPRVRDVQSHPLDGLARPRRSERRLIDIGSEDAEAGFQKL